MSVLENEPSGADTALQSTVHRTVSDVGEGQLNNLVTQSDGGTLFHRYEWLAAIEEGLPHEPRHVQVLKDGNPVGFLPNFAQEVPLPSDVGSRVAETLPFEVVMPPPPGYGGPIATGDEGATLNCLFDPDRLTDRFRTLAHVVHTFDLETIRYGRYLEACGYSPRLTECGLFLDLDQDWGDVRANMHSSRRRAMDSAVEQDYEVTITELGDDLDRTYDEYVGNMERVGGDVLPRAVFDALADRIAERVLVFTAVVDGEEAGRYVYLLDDESGVVHHWLSAIGDEAYFESSPSELLHRRAIRWGIQRGYDQYCFGPTNPHFSDSVFRFKAQYGAKPLPSLRWECGTLPVVWDAYDFGRSWYRRSQIDAT